MIVVINKIIIVVCPLSVCFFLLRILYSSLEWKDQQILYAFP